MRKIGKSIIIGVLFVIVFAFQAFAEIKQFGDFQYSTEGYHTSENEYIEGVSIIHYTATSSNAEIIFPDEINGLPVLTITSGTVTNSDFFIKDVVRDSVKRVVLPESLMEIFGSFSNCKELEEVVFTGNNLKEIHTGSFRNCAKLKSINLPEGVELIFNNAFSGCDSLTEFTIPSTVNTLGRRNVVSGIKLKKVTNLASIDFEIESIKQDGITWYRDELGTEEASIIPAGGSVYNVDKSDSSSGGNSTGSGNSGSSGGSGGGGTSSGGGGSSSGGSGGSGGGGSSKKKTTASTNIVSLPEYVVKGTWTATAEGNWTFADSTGLVYKNKWAAVYNPYANPTLGQENFDWFYFGANGIMATGWILDNGLWYYLSPVSDGTKGKMVTGWAQIDGYWYYLNPVSDGTRGAMYANRTTPDGYTVDANGRRVQ